VQLLSGSTVVATLATYSNLTPAPVRAQVVRHSSYVSTYQGKTFTVKFTGTEELVAGDLLRPRHVSLKTN